MKIIRLLNIRIALSAILLIMTHSLVQAQSTELKNNSSRVDSTYKIDSAEFKILTAGSLNFYGSPQFSKYVGQMDIRLPNLAKILTRSGDKSKRAKYAVLGFNTGVFTKNYYSDSLFRGTGKFNVRNGSDSLNFTSKTINRSSRVIYSVYGAYFNPTVLLFKNDIANGSGNFRLYLDASMEVLSTTAKTNYQYKLLDSTFHRYNSTINSDNVLSSKDPRIYQPNTVENWITGFYGIGPQMYYMQEKIMEVNILMLGGMAITSYNRDLENPLYSQTIHTRGLFYLAKGVITEKFSKLNATIGVEVRGMLPDKNPSIAAYLGVLINPSALFK